VNQIGWQHEEGDEQVRLNPIGDPERAIFLLNQSAL
jgi:hypothetical protein